jgi:hypothetical protein
MEGSGRIMICLHESSSSKKNLSSSDWGQNATSVSREDITFEILPAQRNKMKFQSNENNLHEDASNSYIYSPKSEKIDSLAVMRLSH